MYDTAGYSRIATRNVDFKQFPKFKSAPFMLAKVEPGDCLYVPGTYMHNVYSHGSENVQVSTLFSAPDMATAIHLVNGKTISGKAFAKSPHLPSCENGLPSNTPIAEVDVAWTFDGGAKSPITMGFDSPTNWFHGMKTMIKSLGKPLTVKAFLKAFLGMDVRTFQQFFRPKLRHF